MKLKLVTLTEAHNYTGTSRAKEIVFEFSNTDKSTEAFTKALNEISRMEYENEITTDVYDETIKELQEIFKNRNKDKNEASLVDSEETQVEDIAKKEEYQPLVMPTFKKGKKLRED